MSVSTTTIVADGANLHVEERGRGEALILLHGMTGTGHDWERLFDLDALAGNYRVIVPDARGHGRSTGHDGEFTFGQCARDLHVHGDEQIERLWKLPARLAEETIDLSFTAGQLGTIKARTLLVSGDRDPFYPVELAVEMYRCIPRSALWVVPEGLHLPVFLAEREIWAKRAIEFLRG